MIINWNWNFIIVDNFLSSLYRDLKIIPDQIRCESLDNYYNYLYKR